MTDRGENLLNAARVMEAFGSEIEAFKDELQKTLLGLGDDASVSFGEEDNAPDDDAYYDANVWVLRGWRWTFPAKERRHGRGGRRNLGALSVVADLGRLGSPTAALGFPCLIVAWSKLGGWEEDLDEITRFWPRSDQQEELRAERLFWWLKDPSNGEDEADAEERRARPARDASWFYLVPIIEVSGPAKLKSLVVDPVLKLLGGSRAEEAFSGADEVLRFRWEGGVSVPSDGYVPSPPSLPPA
ncbi:hypothetical protein [Siccirubricoccus sp. G192]|uniref:hypothetical protein n=1 Tax=Siccirubricoccus sp. G192 TaxID=2849651 RepID=UPI001C2BE77F|nr:hypothetical protein [Siccirubricoccus sp. G192]MBV1800500.1 hypothetical protein [Siccirubricoccus sp. G192]